MAVLRRALSGDLEVVGNLEVHGRSTSLTLLAEVDLREESAALSIEVVITKRRLDMNKVAPAKTWVTVHAHFYRDQR